MATKTAFQVQIPRRNSLCAASEAPIPRGATYYSLVYESPEGYTREDYSEDGWDKQGRNRCAELEGVHWKGTVPQKKKALLPADRDAKALKLLKEALKDEENPEDAFMLGLYLQRRRRLALRQAITKNEKNYGLYEILANEEMLTIPHLTLSQLEINKIQQRLAEKFQADEEE